MIRKQKISQEDSNASCRGMMLIELCIVLTIVALFMVGLMQFYKQQRARQFLEVNAERTTTIRNAIKDFVLRYNRLPCVARLNVLPTDPAYGVEILNTTIATTLPTPPNPPASGCATNPAIPAGTFRVAGAVNHPPVVLADSPPVPNIPAPPSPPQTNSPASVRIGALPVRTLGLPDSYIADSSDRIFLYAVTESLTINSGGNLDTTKGSIQILKNSGNPLDPKMNDALYVVVGPGKDGKGAYSRGGSLISNCATLPVTKDTENCDMDSTFIEAEYSEAN